MRKVVLAVLLGALLTAPAAEAKRTVAGELARMQRAGAIAPEEAHARLKAYRDTKKVARRMSGRRELELLAVVRNVEQIAADGALTVARLEPLWLTLQRNREWWTSKPLPAGGMRTSFPGSELVWQYYPGQGLQLQPLATFGKLNGLWAGKLYDDRLARLTDELLALAVQRGDGIAWEYYFHWGAGKPPWVSGMAQATGLQALARAAIRLQRKEEIFPVTQQALRLFSLPAPVGVRVRSDRGEGSHYLLYSFDRRQRVLNAFAQALVGLFDYGKYANDDEARALFTEGDLALRREAPAYDTGAWSLYERPFHAAEASLSYHRLSRDFLRGLCQRVPDGPYCGLADNFTRYLSEPPVMQVLTTKLRGGRRGAVRFGLSKASRTAITIARGDKVVFTNSAADMHYGTRYYAWTPPRGGGTFAVRLDAVDRAGNAGVVRGAIEVAKAPRKKRERHG